MHIDDIDISGLNLLGAIGILFVLHALAPWIKQILPHSMLAMFCDVLLKNLPSFSVAKNVFIGICFILAGVFLNIYSTEN